jgi:hypothetical protein
MHPSTKRIIVILYDTFTFSYMRVAMSAAAHTSAYVSIRQHTSAAAGITASIRQQQQASPGPATIALSAYVSIRQHTSAYVSSSLHHCILAWQRLTADCLSPLYRRLRHFRLPEAHVLATSGRDSGGKQKKRIYPQRPCRGLASQS